MKKNIIFFPPENVIIFKTSSLPVPVCVSSSASLSTTKRSTPLSKPPAKLPKPPSTATTNIDIHRIINISKKGEHALSFFILHFIYISFDLDAFISFDLHFISFFSFPLISLISFPLISLISFPLISFPLISLISLRFVYIAFRFH